MCKNCLAKEDKPCKCGCAMKDCSDFDDFCYKCKHYIQVSEIWERVSRKKAKK